MGDGDEAINLSPSFFASNVLWLGVFLVPAARCSLPALSVPRTSCRSPRLACRLPGRWAGRVCRAVVRRGGACRSSLVPHVGWRNGGTAGRLACVPRLGAQFGLRVRSAFLVSILSAVQRVACPAWLIPVIGAGGEIGFLCLLGWSGECGDYVNYRLSVDCFGTGVYINTRALIGFSFRCFLARACCVGGFSVLLLPPIALVYAPMNWFLRGTNGSDFFYRFSFHLIPSLGCLLRVRFLLLDY